MTEHPYERIAESIRKRIRDGSLVAGERLPSVRALAKQWSVSTTTIRHALSWLAVEGYIRTSPRGTFVSDSPPVTSTALERLMRLQRTGSALGTGESAKILSAERVRPPLYVAELFGTEPEERIARREFVVGKGLRRLFLAVHWYPLEIANEVPELCSNHRVDALQLIEHRTGRRPIAGREAMHAREATEREANFLGIRVGAPVLGHVHEWCDENGVIQYGEWVIPPLVTIGYAIDEIK